MTFANMLLSLLRSPRDTDIAEHAQNNASKSLLDDPNVVAVIKTLQRGAIDKSLNIRYKHTDEEIQKNVSSYLADFMRPENCEVTKRFTFDFWSAVFIAHKAAFGGCMVRHHFNHKEFKYGYKFEVIDIRRIDTSYNDSGFVNGFKYGKYNEITAIRIFKNDEKNESSSVPYSELTIYGGLLDDIHRYYPISEIKPSSDVLEGLKDYEKAIINTQKEASKRGIIIRSKSFADIASNIREFYNKKFKKRGDKVGVSDLEEYESKIDGLRLRKVGSEVEYIPYEDEVVSTNFMNNINYEEVTKSAKSTIASSFGIDDMSAFNRVTPSYVAALLGTKKSNTTHAIEAKNLFDHIIIDILENFIRGIASKRLLVVDDLEHNFLEYNRFTYHRKDTSHIDPAKTAKAIKVDLIDTKITTLEFVLAEKGITLDEYLESKKRSSKVISEIEKLDKSEVNNG